MLMFTCLIFVAVLMEDTLQELLPFRAGRLLIEHPGLDDLLVHVQLVPGGRQNPLLHRIDRHQPQHAHLPKAFKIANDTHEMELNKIPRSAARYDAPYPAPADPDADSNPNRI